MLYQGLLSLTAGMVTKADAARRYVRSKLIALNAAAAAAASKRVKHAPNGFFDSLCGGAAAAM